MNNQENDFDIELTNNFCKYHDGMGSYNLATHYYESLKEDIDKIKSYRKFKHKYIINGKKYISKKIQTIIQVYESLGILIEKIETTLPNENDNYKLTDDETQPLIYNLRIFKHENQEITEPYEWCRFEAIMCTLVFNNDINYSNIKYIIQKFYKIVKNL